MEYKFDTEAELSAFLQGVDEASGWLDYVTTVISRDGKEEVIDDDSDIYDESDDE